MTDKPQKNREEETKEPRTEYRPKTAGGNKNQGKPQGNQNQNQKPRPETAAPKQRNANNANTEDQNDKRDKRQGGQGGNQANKNANKRTDQDVNSWKYKFHNREPKKYDKIVFTDAT